MLITYTREEVHKAMVEHAERQLYFNRHEHDVSFDSWDSFGEDTEAWDGVVINVKISEKDTATQG